MGAIPIVRTSTLDPMFEGLPVVIVQNWNEVTEEFLQRKYEEMQQQSFQWEKLQAEYWFRCIDETKFR